MSESKHRQHEFLKIEDLHDLTFFLGHTLSKFNFFLYRIPPEQRYRKFEIAKRKEGKRTISTPIRPIKEMQRKVAGALNEIFHWRSGVHGFVAGRSIKSNAYQHRNRRWVGRVDLKEFFPSIHFGRVYGMFKSQPFGFQDSVASRLAHLCTYEGRLPQGAPTSPVISNIICRGLDKRVADYCRSNRVAYTRYADDLTFSTDLTSFPGMIIRTDGARDFVVGSGIEDIVAGEGFAVNGLKTTLHSSNGRQLVTGLVVNEGVNVPREYVRELRALLHFWKENGKEATEEYFFARHYRKTVLTPKQDGSSFEDIVIGRVRHIGNIKGWSSNRYLQLAHELSRLSRRFKINKNKSYTRKQRVIRVLTEGKTDEYHLTAALRALQTKGKYNDLELHFVRSPDGEGAQSLLRALKNHCNVEQKLLTVCLFDRDIPKTLAEVERPEEGFRDWGNRVFSCAIPESPIRAMPNVCIELYYRDEELKLTDANGRRLFFREEFNENGDSKCGKYTLSNPRGHDSLLAQGKVYARADVKKMNNLLLSKNSFAINVLEGVQPYHDLCFDNFSEIFDRLLLIQDRDLSTRH